VGINKILYEDNDATAGYKEAECKRHLQSSGIL